MFRVILWFVVFASEIASVHSEAVAASHVRHVRLSKIREIVALLQGISQRTRIEEEKEKVLYEDVKRFCEANEATAVVQADTNQVEETADTNQAEETANEETADTSQAAPDAPVVSSTPPTPQVVCALPMILAGVQSWSGANCASGAANVPHGTACEIHAASGYTCTSPGVCGSNGQFASLAICEATCAIHSCPTGYAFIASRSSSKIVTDANCCEATCAIHSCPRGYTRMSAHSSSTTVTDANCCQATCASHSCPSGYTPIVSRSSATLVSDEHCCQAKRRKVANLAKLKVRQATKPKMRSSHRDPEKQVKAAAPDTRHISNPPKASTAFISQDSQEVASDQFDDADTGEALQNMDDLLKADSSEGAATQDQDDVVHESEALESAIENTEDNLKSEATQEEAIVKEQLKADLKDYAKSDSSSVDKLATQLDASSSNEDDTTEALMLPESGDSLPALSSSEHIVHTRTARVVPRASVALIEEKRSTKQYTKTQSAVNSMDKDAQAAKEMGRSGSSSSQRLKSKQSDAKGGRGAQSAVASDALHKFAASLPNLDDLAHAIPNDDKDALSLDQSVESSDSNNDDSPDIPASFVQVLQEQIITLPQADLDAVWNSLNDLADQTREGLSMIDLLRHTAHNAQPKKHTRMDRRSQGMQQQCTWLMQNFAERQEKRAKVKAILKQAKTILGRTRIPAGRLRGSQ